MSTDIGTVFDDTYNVKNALYLRVIIRVCILSITSIGSTIALFGAAGVNSNVYSGWFVDFTINVLCVHLMFRFCDKFWKCCCRCCDAKSEEMVDVYEQSKQLSRV